MTGCNNSNFSHVYTAIIKKRKSRKRKLTSDRNELMYNFQLVIRVLIANRLPMICDWEGGELGEGG